MYRVIWTPKGEAVVFYNKKTTPKGKKYSVITPKGKLIHFGDTNYGQYEDKIFGRYADGNHHDSARREAYKKRHSNDNIDDPEYPGYWSWRYLW